MCTYHCNVRVLLGDRVYASIDEAQSLKVQLVCLPCFTYGLIVNLRVLFLEKLDKARPIMTAVRLGPEVKVAVIGLILRELLEPGLQEMPSGPRSCTRGIGRVCFFQ